MGRGGDCLGNRQLAEYKLAIALLKSGDVNAAVDLFILMSEEPTHLRHQDMSIWLPKIALGDCPARRVFTAVARFDPGGLPSPPGPNRQAGYYAFRLVRGRGFLELGRLAEAEAELDVASARPEFTEGARECLSICRAGDVPQQAK